MLPANLITTLQKGGVIAYPTEAVYGLGCDPFNAVAIERLLAVKERNPNKGLIIIAANWEQCLPFVSDVPAEKLAQAQATWPGPFTWVFPAKKTVSTWLRGQHQTIAIRITDHPIAKSICEKFGSAIVSTSANKDGQSPATTAEMVRAIFGFDVDCLVPGDVGNAKKPTEIKDVLTGQIIRAG